MLRDGWTDGRKEKSKVLQEVLADLKKSVGVDVADHLSKNYIFTKFANMPEPLFCIICLFKASALFQTHVHMISKL